ncbi:diguanylate cyclase [Sphingoaurantiacus capsulatus]|uniref:Diguanylate cyclase n=1 Tax=Sphingoaurantiacus capsulatus TaxID=1771310 RepID=A0ABV7XDK1_9SPHN
MKTTATGSRVEPVLERAAHWLTHLARPTVVALSALMLIVVGGLDLAIVREVNLGAFYVLPVCMAAWALGIKAGLITAVAAAVARTISYAGDVGVATPGVLIFNAGSAIVPFSLVALLLGTVRGHFDDTREMASIDALTGTLNKRAFMEAADEALARLPRRGGGLMLAYLDLDGFKAVNDTAGHAAGDDVLRAFADAARQEVRADDLLGRVGGDEFVLLRGIDDLADAYATAAAIHTRLCTALDRLPHAVSCSMGAVIVRAGDVADQQRLLGMADALMYEVKRSGKNSLRLALASDDHGFMPPPVPADEATRQGAIDKLELARLARKPAFQKMVQQAADIIGTPMAAISIIDRDRQWFVAEKGVDADETPRAVSFCGHAINGDAPMVINDAALDSRFGGNPLVRGDPGVRFYAGAPLVTSEGQKLGALCVIDTRPRELTAEQAAALTALASRVAHELEAGGGED